ncbi:hypothetical protein RM780_01210 [Streptomyces sp. DSM 44917]|uniref:Uncharacterized protein n=1 Tax=Streptomyces boetiae TaxID=3075541 RepID=A0ABU2L209_9ACTN|nr:hypothetical protein [Streptomyces sp. DSM 44917]MDT0305585.1 hypothetical protein [Streptomyces sp. DSM 44917]
MHDQGDATPPDDPPASHRITLTERGPFVSPRCACGWYGPARRSRPLARAEAAAHLTDAHAA